MVFSPPSVRPSPPLGALAPCSLAVHCSRSPPCACRRAPPRLDPSPLDSVRESAQPSPDAHCEHREAGQPNQDAHRVDEGLDEQQRMAEAHRPITHETARAQRQHSRAEVARSAGQEQEPGVVGEQMQPVKLHRVVPANPAVARRALQRRCRVSAPFRKCTKTAVVEVLVTSWHLLRYLFDSLSSSPPDGLGQAGLVILLYRSRSRRGAGGG